MSFRTALSQSTTQVKEWQDNNPAIYPTWTRNSNWLAMPTLPDTAQQINLLVAVYDITGGNTVSFSCAGAYSVDWGDGTSNTYATGATASHQYSFSDPDLTTTAEIYKQGMVVVTPQSGQNITAFNMSSKPAGFSAGMPQNWLDIQVIAPNMTATGFIFTNSTVLSVSNTQYPVLEYIKLQKLNANANISLGFNNSRALRRVDFGSFSLANMDLFFTGCSSLIEVNGISMSAGASAIQAFENCLSLVTAPYITNLQNITNSAASMFSGCAKLRFFSNGWLDFSANTSGNFSNFFANCSSLEYAPFIKFNTGGSSISLSSMFSGCVALRQVPAYNTSNVFGMANMFTNCEALLEIPAMNFSNVTDTSSMFSGCRSLMSAPAFNIPVVTTTASMFANCSNLLNMPNITTGTALTSTVSMFSGCASLISTVSFNTINVTNATSMFSGCRSLISVPDNQYNLVNCLNFTSMFNACVNLKQAPALTTTAATTMTSMFAGCSNLITVPLYDLNGVTTTATMFQNCAALQSLPAFNMTTVTTLTSMLNGCSALREIPAWSMNTAAVYTTMFSTTQGITRNRMTGINATVSMSLQNLAATELNEIYTNLSATGAGKTITVTGNWGTATDNPAIATAKGWTVTG